MGRGNDIVFRRQRYRARGRGEAGGQVNLKYGKRPRSYLLYSVPDQYAPFHTKVINAAVQDTTHVLDGLLYHESDLRIEETISTRRASLTTYLPFAIYSDFVSLPEFVTWPTSVYVPGKAGQWSSLSPLIGKAHRATARRLAASIQQGTVTASLILRKLGSYRRQNSLALAFREIGRIERSMFTWPGSKILHCVAASLQGSIRASKKLTCEGRLLQPPGRSPRSLSSEEHCCGSALGQLKK